MSKIFVHSQVEIDKSIWKILHRGASNKLTSTCFLCIDTHNCFNGKGMSHLDLKFWNEIPVLTILYESSED